MIKEKFDVRVHKTYHLKDAAQAQTVSIPSSLHERIAC